MLRNYKYVDRCSDGISLCPSECFVYLKDINDTERIGNVNIGFDGNKSILTLDDIASGKRLIFEGDHFSVGSSNWNNFNWFPSFQEYLVLYKRKGDFNDIQKQTYMLQSYSEFVHCELVLDTLNTMQPAPVNKESQDRIFSQLSHAAFVYSYSVELLYAAINGNGDVLFVNTSWHDIGVIHPLRNISAEDIIFSGSFDGFLLENPKLRDHLVDGGMSVSAKPYDTPEIILDDIKRHISDEILELRYQRFKSERQVKKKLEGLRGANPLETLEEQIKQVDTSKKHRIWLGTAREDLDKVNDMT